MGTGEGSGCLPVRCRAFSSIRTLSLLRTRVCLHPVYILRPEWPTCLSTTSQMTPHHAPELLLPPDSPFLGVALHLPGYQDRNQETSSSGPSCLSCPIQSVSSHESTWFLRWWQQPPVPTCLLPPACTRHCYPSQPCPDLQPSSFLGPRSVCSMHVP